MDIVFNGFSLPFLSLTGFPYRILFLLSSLPFWLFETVPCHPHGLKHSMQLCSGQPWSLLLLRPPLECLDHRFYFLPFYITGNYVVFMCIWWVGHACAMCGGQETTLCSQSFPSTVGIMLLCICVIQMLISVPLSGCNPYSKFLWPRCCISTASHLLSDLSIQADQLVNDQGRE